MNFEDMLQTSPYSLDKEEKGRFLTERLGELTEKHRESCPQYRNMLESAGYDSQKLCSYKELPFLPVRLFKELELRSVPKEEVVKTMTSSGTTGQAVSKIYLDRVTSANQQKVMVKIVSDFTGSSRMPMIILDCPSVVKNRQMFSARGAGILGFSIFGAKRIYALDDDMKLDVSGGGLYRLKKGIMRYFAAPGKLELDIVAFCEKKNIRWALWPQLDRYDVEIQFSDGEVWEIDAKAYRNPIALRTKILNDNGFPTGDYARGYYVIPNEYTANQKNYTTIINRALKNQENVMCVTLRALKSEISKKEAACHEE